MIKLLLLCLMVGSFAEAGTVIPGSAKPNFYSLKPCADEVAQFSGYTPAQIKKAYHLDQLRGGGAGQTIAIIDAYGSPTLSQDVAGFSSAFGLPEAQLSIRYPYGRPTEEAEAWASETTIDVEWAHAIAPRAKILLIIVPTDSQQDLFNGVQYAATNAARFGVSQVSMSWGGPEWGGEGATDQVFKTPGVTFIASAGDVGAQVQWPSSSPYVLAVGGTTLLLNANGTIRRETAWDGSGGGISQFEPRPQYQARIERGHFRSVPDVSFVADPATGLRLYYTMNGTPGWFIASGTSLGAPQWAAITALVNATRPRALGFLNAALYLLDQSFFGTSFFFRDVNFGCSGEDSSVNCARRGYDSVTGLGSPRGDTLLFGLDFVLSIFR